tara:strand:+ start:227 stop:1006 length:780 start_codon:yes stop_codon:yes gene_type:complete
MFNIATPISGLFSNNKNYKNIADLSDCLELRHNYPYKESKKNKLFHFEFQPIHDLSSINFNYIDQIIKKNKHLELITFHMASCYDMPKIIDGKFIPGGKKYTPEEMYKNAKKNFSIINQIVGNSIKIGVENNNYFRTPAYEHIAEPSFISKIISDNNIYFLYDLAHGTISAYNLGVNYDQYFKSLPLDKIIQLHICKSSIKNNEAYDAHFLPDKKVYEEVINLIKNSKNLKFLTIEYYRDAKKLIKSIEKLKKIIKKNE